MDQGLDDNKPQSTSYRETFRRHRKLLCIPIILGGLAAAFFLFGTGRTYKSTASVWVDTSPPAPSSLGASAMSEPPAAAEQTILSELLTTRAFAASVAKTAAGGKSVSGADAAALLGNAQIMGTVAGGQVLQISSSASSPTAAQDVLGAVVAQLRRYTDRLAAQHDQATVADGRAQVKAAETALATARGNVTTYQAQHPQVTQADPTYASLVAAENNATAQLAQANTALSQMASNVDGWSITVIDPPSRATTAPLRKTKMAEVILGGALGGLLVSFLAVVALTPAKKEVWEDELPIGGPLVPNVPPADPFFRAASPGVPTAPAQAAPAATAVGQPQLSLGNRRFQFRNSSPRTEEE
jgi:uncharacterized protein involved in exopolysaccharide biosynthesis